MGHKWPFVAGVVELVYTHHLKWCAARHEVSNTSARIMPNQIAQSEEVEITNLFVKENMTVRQISRKIGRSHTCVSKYLRLSGHLTDEVRLQNKKRGTDAMLAHNGVERLSQDSLATIRVLALEGKTSREIAKLVGCSQGAAWRFMGEIPDEIKVQKLQRKIDRVMGKRDYKSVAYCKKLGIAIKNTLNEYPELVQASIQRLSKYWGRAWEFRRPFWEWIHSIDDLDKRMEIIYGIVNQWRTSRKWTNEKFFSVLEKMKTKAI